MNKVYKVIWSEARNAYVVVSEMAKSMGSKSCSTKKLLAMLLATGVMTCAGVAPAMAANLAPEDTQIAAGEDAEATGSYGVAVGKNTKATGYDSTAIGHSANASGLDSIAAGVNSTASGKWSVAVGNKANAGAEGGIAIGSNANAQADTQINNVDAIAIGRSAQTSGEDSIAMGMQAVASKNYSVAIGGYTKNTGIGAVAIGQQANVSGDYATAIGGYSAASKDWSTALGDYAKATGERSTAIGAYSTASGNYSTATGMLAKAEGEIATAVGYQSNAQGAQATALGYKSNAAYGQSMALGSFAATGNEFATAVGYASAANAYRSTAIGDFSNASAEKSVALGAGSVADRAAGVTGYGAPSGAANSSTWTSTSGAVSVGSEADGVTRQITNVAAGSADTDAVNVAQLKAASAQSIDNSIRINNLSSRVNKVGAGAAALAALHPMDFDPDDKWSFAAGYGNYAGENAAAVGAYYRPDEKVMFSVGGTVGNGENMVNAGISFALDRTNRVSNSRTAMAREILDLRAEVAELKAMVAKGGLGSIDEDKLKLFPDVPENHWAYEYIAKLAGNGILEGYPDGSFDGDRMMSRYEFAAMLYRAMQNGAQLDSKIINEFAPEMGRIRVDRISGKDGDRSKIERVRVNGPKTERDHYGSKLAK